MSDASQAKRPFVATHRRVRDGLQAMVLGCHGGNVLYRVRWLDSGRPHENTLVRSVGAFDDLFAPEIVR
jgi:hypothetical protein